MFKFDFDGVISALTSDKLNNKRAELLSKSLFYYCSGVDPTPIAALYSEFPIFIYSDILRRFEGGLSGADKVLTARLTEHGFLAVETESIDIGEGAILTLFEKDGVKFLLLFVKGDAFKTYSAIYGTDRALLPRCIANIRYEMNTSRFLPIEKEVELILGYSYSGRHRAVMNFEYLGDYTENGVTLFERE